ncbi:MAG: hypothetical protein ACXWLH_06115 [Candidatus Saccharimonadales bacterium]
MPGYVDIGTQSGMAAPGESSPRALLTTSGLVLGSSGGLPAQVYPPGYLLLNDAGTTTTNPTSATTLLAGGAVTNLWPTYVAAGDMVHVVVGGTYNMATSTTVTFTIMFGSTAVATFASGASTGTKSWYADVRFIMNSSTSVVPTGVAYTRATGSGFQAPVAISEVTYSDSVAITVTAAPQNFDVKGLVGTGNASSVINLKTCQVRYYPKGY